MSNPFDEIEQRLTNIECLLAELKLSKKSVQKEPLAEQPISQNEAARFLGKSRQTLIAWRRRGIIHSHSLGGRIYFLKSELLSSLMKTDK